MVTFMPSQRGGALMHEQIHQYVLEKRSSSRAFLYGIVIAINVLLWILLVAFHWEISLRAREVAYYGRQLFPLRSQAVPLPVIYGACALLNLISLSTILRDRNNLAARERLQTLLAQILESLEIGVVVLDRKGYLNLANESARKLLHGIPKRHVDTQYLDVFGDYPELIEIVKSALERDGFVKEVEHDLDLEMSPAPPESPHCRSRVPTGGLMECCCWSTTSAKLWPWSGR
jgi:PAS domain-containing protein